MQLTRKQLTKVCVVAAVVLALGTAVILPTIHVKEVRLVNGHQKYFGFTADTGMSANLTFTTPPRDTTAGLVWTTNGAGKIIWLDPASIHVHVADSLSGWDTVGVMRVDRTNTMSTIGFIRGSDGYLSMRTPNEAKTITLNTENSGSNYAFVFRNPAGHEGEYMKVEGGTNVYAAAPDSVRTSGRVFRIRVGGSNYRQDSITVVTGSNITLTQSNDTIRIASADSIAKAYAAYAPRYTLWWTSKKSAPATADSGYANEVPAGQTWIIDSVKAGKVGAFTGTVNVDRLHSGTYARMYASSYTLTTTMTNMGSITNNTLSAGDQVFFIWSAPGGTTASNDVINLTFFYRQTQ